MSDFRVPFSTAQAAFGVSATVTRPTPDHLPVTTLAVWMPPPLEPQQPYGTELQRRDPRRLMALPRDVLTTLKRGTEVEAPEELGGAVKKWRVEELDRTETDHWRVVVTEQPR